MPDQQRVTLPPGLMQAVKVITASYAMPPQHRFAAVLMLVYGAAWYGAQESVDPTGIALPEEQWRTICAWLTTGVEAVDRVDQVNLSLDWMNRGPSAYPLGS